ncbi:mandelate racemase/muconate lactonizing enzyme family protein [Treponema primitia]|uniref:mandelate racemase/muconate lactonizing enzyme family protein n=1 Tax=Treponema primitia TaxID=88058 RepID=UPI0039806B82
MKITDLRVIPAKHYLFIQIDTDEGITGLGEAGNWGFLGATAAALEKLKEFIIGKDPSTIEYHYQNMYRAMYFRGSVIMSALSAIDIALWDIKGKLLGVPVYELLGGKTRNKIRVYASGFGSQTADEMVKGCKTLKEKGFTAAKLFLTEQQTTPGGEREFFSNKIELLIEKVRRCREAVGNDFDLIMEMHRSLTSPEAVALCREAEQYRPFNIEDPIIPDNPDAMGALAHKINIPIATGERFICMHEFQTLLARGGAFYVRPDVCAVGGISQAKKVAAVAEAHGVQIIPHNPLGPVSTAACVQLSACIPNLGIMELPDFCLDGREDAMVKKPLEIKNGCIIVPNGPGIGIELSDKAADLFPAKDRATKGAKISFDGSVLDW